MDVARHIILGLLFITMGLAAYAVNAQLDPLWRLGSLVAAGTVASVGSLVFFYSALKGR